MKALALFLLSFICLIANAQDTTKVKLPLKDNQIVFEGVVQVDSTSKQHDLYNAAKTWFVNTFKSAKAVIQSDDQINGRIIGKGYMHLNGVTLFNNPISPDIKFSIQIDVKDHKYRYRFYDLTSQFNVFNTYNEFTVESEYSDYLQNENKKGWAISREAYNKRADNAFRILVDKINSLSESLKSTMSVIKNDGF